MAHEVNRREFLKAASAASAAFASLAPVAARAPASAAARPKITDIAFAPADYPIVATRYSDVVIEDVFLEAEGGSQCRGHDSLRGSEARRWPARLERQRAGGRDAVARTHPNPALQAQVERAVAAFAAREESGDGNSGFEVGSHVTTTRPAGASCWIARFLSRTRCTTISRETIRRFPAASATRSIASSCTARRATRSISLWRKHYLDIRGLDNSVEPQPPQPVVHAGARAERSGRPCGELRLADGVAGRCRRADRTAGVPSRRRADVDRRRRPEDVHDRRRRVDRQRRLRRAVRAAEHLRVCGDVRRPDVHDAQPPAVSCDRRQPLHRRDRTRHVQQRASTACRRRPIVSSTSTVSRAPATAATLRWQHASLECCPPNLVRFLRRMPG